MDYREVVKRVGYAVDALLGKRMSLPRNPDIEGKHDFAQAVVKEIRTSVNEHPTYVWGVGHEGNSDSRWLAETLRHTGITVLNGPLLIKGRTLYGFNEYFYAGRFNIFVDSTRNDEHLEIIKENLEGKEGEILGALYAWALPVPDYKPIPLNGSKSRKRIAET